MLRSQACSVAHNLTIAARLASLAALPISMILAASPCLAMRRIKRGTGVFFCFVFCHVAENEETLSEKHPGSVEPLRGLHQWWRV